MNRKRYVVKNKFRFYSFIFLISISLTLFAFVFISSDAKADKDQNYKVIKVEYGDTIWDIAKKYNQEPDIRKYIFEIRKFNNLDSADIQPGDLIKVPID
ncbi:MAG: LysM peptidoglycan-binding domain-containing protein [Tissierellia bacterium]|nr:LysM peptidoglycan-binding domain-containing protein [Tissierellia bacterium]